MSLTCRAPALAALLAFQLVAGCAPWRAGRPAKLVPLQLKLPARPIHEPPRNRWSIPYDEPDVDIPSREPRPPFLVPEGTGNLAAHRPVTSSDPVPILGSLDQITDGDKWTYDGSVVELGPGLQWVQIDLEQRAPIYAIVVWHDFIPRRRWEVCRDVIVQVADDPRFRRKVRTLFNNDRDNSAGLGAGRDKSYAETYEGKLIDAKGVVARYFRLYARGGSDLELSRYIEVEVYGLGTAKPSPERPGAAIKPTLPGDVAEATRRGDLKAVEALIAAGASLEAKDGLEDPLLVIATKQGHRQLVEWLLKQGADADTKGCSGRTALHCAAAAGDSALVRVLHAGGASLRVVDGDSATPLHGAAEAGHTAVVAFVLAQGADANARDRQGRTPLHLAALMGHCEVAKALINCGAATLPAAMAIALSTSPHARDTRTWCNSFSPIGPT